MGKFGQSLSTAGLRVGNTAATPLRIGGEIANAGANVIRQGISGTKNIAEVTKQTLDALVHNFTDFSKVEGKWYQKLLKVPANLVSAITRRPAMITASGVASAANQGVREPFKKLLYTPGKMFKGMRNSMRLFSKKKGFDFEKYDTHETKEDTRASNRKAKSLGFFGAKKGVIEEKKIEKKVEKIEEKKVEVKEEKKGNEVESRKAGEEPKKAEEKKIEKKAEEKKVEEPKKEEKREEKREEKKPEEGKEKPVEKKVTEQSEGIPHTAKDGTGGGKEKKADTPKPIDDKKNEGPEEAPKKDKEKKVEEKKEEKKGNEVESRIPLKTAQEAGEELKKEYDKRLKNKLHKGGIIERGKEAKMGDTLEDIMKNLKEKDPTFVGYLEEILSQPKKKKHD